MFSRRFITDRKIIGENECLEIYEPETLQYQKPILAIHGMWGTNQRWENYGCYFSELGFRFMAVTLRHHFLGNQENQKLGRVSVKDYYWDAAKLIHNIKSGGLEYAGRLPAPIIFGHSMGGLIAQKLAAENMASLLVLLNSAPPAEIPLYSSTAFQLAIARYFPKIFFYRPFKPGRSIASYFILNGLPICHQAVAYNNMVHESGRAAWEIITGRVSVNFDAIRCPTFVIGCQNDRIVSPQVASSLNKELTYCESHLEIYDNFAHWVQTEPQWIIPASAIKEWLDIQLEQKRQSATRSL